MSDESFGELLEKKGQRFLALIEEIGMSTELFHQVVERTQNFREGFYSQKKIHDLGQSSAKAMIDVQEQITEDQLLQKLGDAVQNLENIKATIMTEIDRIERMS